MSGGTFSPVAVRLDHIADTLSLGIWIVSTFESKHQQLAFYVYIVPKSIPDPLSDRYRSVRNHVGPTTVRYRF